MFDRSIGANWRSTNGLRPLGKHSFYVTYGGSICADTERTLFRGAPALEIHRQQHVEVPGDAVPNQHSFEVGNFLAAD